MGQAAPRLGGTRIDQRAAGVERARVCAADRSKSEKVSADVGTARFVARGAPRRRDARPVRSPAMNVPEPWRLST